MSVCLVGCQPKEKVESKTVETIPDIEKEEEVPPAIYDSINDWKDCCTSKVDTRR